MFERIAARSSGNPLYSIIKKEENISMGETCTPIHLHREMYVRTYRSSKDFKLYYYLDASSLIVCRVY
jgi:hypothetical protein